MSERAKNFKRAAAILSLAASGLAVHAVTRTDSKEPVAVCEAVRFNGETVGPDTYPVGKVTVDYQDKGVVTTREHRMAAESVEHNGTHYLRLERPLDPDMLWNDYTDYSHTKAILFLRFPGDLGRVGLSAACFVRDTPDAATEIVMLPVR